MKENSTFCVLKLLPRIVRRISALLCLSLFVSLHINAANEQDSAAKATLAVQSGNKQANYQGTDWELTSLKGEKIRLSNFQGQPVILVFWATWCPYCKKLLPGIAELNDKYQSKGLKIIAVNILEDWKPATYWRNHGYTFDAVINGDEIAKIYAIKSTPGIVFIEPSGRVLGVQSFSDPHHPLLEKFASVYVK